MKNLIFCGLLYSNKDYRDKAISELVDVFGNIKLYSNTFSFSDFTDYYDNEIGKDIIREWILFENIDNGENFYEKKLMSIEIEKKFTINNNRNINIDPGRICLSNMQLLTTKNYSHRIYMGEGIYAEVTFIFTKNGIKFLDWTYPDYKTDIAKDFFLKSRNFLKNL